MTMFQGSEAPDTGMWFESGTLVDRYVGDGPEPFYHSVRLIGQASFDQTMQILIGEMELAKSRGRAGFELKTFEMFNAEAAANEVAEHLGFKIERVSRLMYAPSTIEFEIPSEIEVTEIKNDAQFETLLDINEAAFGKRSLWLERSLKNELGLKPHLVRGYYSSIKGQPACTAWIKIYGDIGYLFGGGTHPDLRGHGAYKALVAKRAAFARSCNAGFIISECSPDSERVLRGLGFQDAGKVYVWTYTFEIT